ncbi:hypothetical protein AMJ80_07770, partial [bacterium SM23_31]
MGKIFKKTNLVRLTVILAVVLVFLILIFSILATGPGENFIRGVVEEQLQNTLGQSVKIGTLETNVFSRLQLYDFEIFQMDGDTRIPFVNLRYACVNYRLWHLLKRELFIESVVLDSMFITILKDSAGFSNLPLLSSESKKDKGASSSAFQFHLGNAVLNDVSILYEGRNIPVKFSLNNFNFSLGKQDNESYLFQTRAGSGIINYLEKPVEVTGINVNGLFSGNELQFNDLSLQFLGLKCAGDAVINMGNTPVSLNGNVHVTGKSEECVDLFSDYIPSHLLPIEDNLNITLGLGGSIDEPLINARIEFPQLKIADLGINNVLLEGEYQANTVTLNKLNMELMKGKISGKGYITLDSLLSHSISLSVNNVTLSDVLTYINKERSPYQGFVNGEIKSDGPLLIPEMVQASGEFALQKVMYKSKPVGEFTNRISINKGAVNINSQHGKSLIQAGIKFKDKKLNGNFSIRIIELEPYADFFNISELKGAIDVSGTVSGSLNEPEIAAGLSGEKILYKNFPVDSFNGKVLYSDRKLYIVNATMEGTVSQIDTLNPPLYLHGFTGGFAYQGNVNGTIDDLFGEITARFNKPSYRNFEFDSGNVSMKFENNIVEIHPLELQKDSLLLQLTGKYSIPNSQGNAQIVFLENPQNAGIISFDEQKYSGAIYPKPGIIRTDFDLAPGTRPDYQGWIINVQCEEIDLKKISVLYPDSLNVGGKLEFDMNFTGNFNQPSGNLNFTINSPHYDQVFADSLRGDVRLQPYGIFCEPVEVFLNNNKIRAVTELELQKSPDGFLSVTDQSLFRGALEGNDTDLNILKPFLAAEMNVAGRSTYRLIWEGTLKKPHINGELFISDAELKMKPEAQSIQNIGVIIYLQDSLIKVENVSGKIGTVPLRFAGTIITRNWENFQTQMNLNVSDYDVLNTYGMIYPDSLDFNVGIKDFDISILQPLTPDIKQLKGVLNSVMLISGSFSDPRFSGTLRINKLSLQPPALDTPLTNGIVKMSFDQRKVDIDSVFLQLKEGSIFTYGGMAYQNGELTQLDLKADVNNITIERPKEYVLAVNSGSFSYRKQNNYYELDGDVVLGKSSLYYNFQPKSLLSLMQKVERPAQKPPLIIQNTRLNIRLRESDNIWIDNNLARLRLHSELIFIGSMSQPVVTGRLSAEEGYVLYLDRKFQIKQGVLDFIDPNRVNPFVDLKATTNLKSYQTLTGTPYTITFSLTGPMDKAEFSLTSEPFLDKPDIVALLTVGATRKDLTGKSLEGENVSVSNVLKERAEQLSSQRISGYATRRVGSFFNLDEMSIEGNLFNFGQSWGPQ